MDDPSDAETERTIPKQLASGGEHTLFDVPGESLGPHRPRITWHAF